MVIVRNKFHPVQNDAVRYLPIYQAIWLASVLGIQTFVDREGKESRIPRIFVSGWSSSQRFVGSGCRRTPLRTPMNMQIGQNNTQPRVPTDVHDVRRITPIEEDLLAVWVVGFRSICIVNDGYTLDTRRKYPLFQWTSTLHGPSASKWPAQARWHLHWRSARCKGTQNEGRVRGGWEWPSSSQRQHALFSPSKRKVLALAELLSEGLVSPTLLSLSSCLLNRHEYLRPK